MNMEAKPSVTENEDSLWLAVRSKAVVAAFLITVVTSVEAFQPIEDAVVQVLSGIGQGASNIQG